ncbi:MAG: FKBP-type peptidyl-prolyl cis-trans isomerase [Bacteroidales bacterium]|nr:FKBP-type peptidyl-prolyl cis-trans isomerase [Bacteroidales bacterium]
MKKTLIPAILAAVALLCAGSCAKDVTETNDELQARILKSWIETYYPGLEASESGLYVLEKTPGIGPEIIDDSCYVGMSLTIRTLDGTIISTIDEALCRQLGIYSRTAQYDCNFYKFSNLKKGVQEMLRGMTTGSHVVGVIPPKLLDVSSGTNIVDGDGVSKIYDITVHLKTDDINQFQFDRIYDVLPSLGMSRDSSSYGMWMKKYPPINVTDTLSSSSSIYFYYVGRYLDGKIFDTNIEDTAKKYNIYSSSKSYTYLTFKRDETEAKAISNNSFVKGFSKTLWNMNYEESCTTIFYSGLGYGTEGSGDIRGYEPLRFEIYTLAKSTN